MSARGSARATSCRESSVLSDLEPGREVELELTEGTRVAGTVVQVDEQGVVLERANSQERARIAMTEIVAVLSDRTDLGRGRFTRGEGLGG